MSDSKINEQLQSTTAALKSIFKKSQPSTAMPATSIRPEEKQSLLSIIKSEEPSSPAAQERGSKGISESNRSPSLICANLDKSTAEDAAFPMIHQKQKKSASSQPAPMVFPLDSVDRLPTIKTAVECFPITQFPSLARHPSPKLQVQVNEHYMMYLLKDGSVRAMSKATGEKIVLASEQSRYIGFCLNEDNQVCCTAKDGSIDGYVLQMNNSTPVASTVFSLQLKPEQAYFAQVLFHPTNRDSLFLISRTGEIYLGSFQMLDEEAKKCSGLLSIPLMANGRLPKDLFGIKRFAADEERKVVHFSCSPSDRLFCLLDDKAEFVIASAEPSSTFYHSINIGSIANVLKMNPSFDVIWIPKRKAILFVCQNECFLIDYLNGKIKYRLKFQGLYEGFHFCYHESLNMLITANSSLNCLLFFEIAVETINFFGRLPLQHSVADMAIYTSCKSLKTDIFTIHEEGFCYYSLAMDGLQLVKEGPDFAFEHKTVTPSADFASLPTLLKQESVQIQNALLQSLQSTIPSLVEYAVKEQLEHLLKTKFNAFIKNCIEESFQRQTKTIEEHFNRLQEKPGMGDSTKTKEAFIAIQQNLSKLVELIEESATKSGVETASTAAVQELPVAKPASAPSIKEEVSQLISAGKVDDAFRRVLNVRNLPLLVWLCIQFDCDSFFSNYPLSAPNLLSLIQQLSIDLGQECDTKLHWIQQALLTVDADDATVRKYFVQLFQALSKNLTEFAQTSQDAALVKVAKMALKIATNLVKLLSKQQ